MKRQCNAAIRRLGTALAAAACVAATALQPAHAADAQTCRDVKMAAPGWTDIDATNAMAGVVLKALGYRQDVANLSVPITYQGLKKGQVDVFLGNWMPAQAPLVKPFVDEKAIDVLHANLSGAKFTLAVPDYVAAAGVHTFADLAAHADQFGGKIYGIEPGAPRTRTSSGCSPIMRWARRTGRWSNRARRGCSRRSSARCATSAGSCSSRGSRT